MRRKNNGGFTTVWLVMILSSLMILLLVVTEAAAGFAASSIGENLCASAGRSVLSEYNKALFDRYGIFAVRGGDSRLTKIGSYYIGCGLGNESGLVQMTLGDCSVTGEEFPALSHELLMAQIRPLGTSMGIQSIVSGNTLSELISGLLGASELAGSLEDSQIGALEDLAGSIPDETLEISEEAVSEIANQAAKGDELLQSYDDAMNPDLNGHEGAMLPAGLKAELPSAVLGVSPTLSLLLSGGVVDVSQDAIVAGEYILKMCSNTQSRKENCVLSGEAEYILYGHDSDKANERAAKLSIFEIRSTVNLAEIYADGAKMAEINAEAAAFAPIPQPVAAFAIASVRAAKQAAEDVNTLFSGGRVPFVKGGAGGRYEEYLRILLALLPQKTKLVRLMDVMQMNLTEKEGVAFAFRDFCYGVRIDAHFEKRMHVFGLGGFDRRKGFVSISSQYQ